MPAFELIDRGGQMARHADLSGFLTWHGRHPAAARWILAGPVALLAAILFMAAMPLILPPGAGGIDHLVMPVVLFPLIWAIEILYPVMTSRLDRAAGLLYAAILVQSVVVVGAILQIWGVQ